MADRYSCKDVGRLTLGRYESIRFLLEVGYELY